MPAPSLPYQCHKRQRSSTSTVLTITDLAIAKPTTKRARIKPLFIEELPVGSEAATTSKSIALPQRHLPGITLPSASLASLSDPAPTSSSSSSSSSASFESLSDDSQEKLEETLFAQAHQLYFSQSASRGCSIVSSPAQKLVNYENEDDEDTTSTSSSSITATDLEDPQVDDDATSSSSSSSSGPHSDASATPPVQLKYPWQPGYLSPLIPHLPTTALPSPAPLKEKVSAFLAAMRDANQALEDERTDGRLEERNIENLDEEEGGQYIEMNLGLGVFEEKREGEENESGDEDDGEDNETDILGRLMGMRGEEREKPTIVEVEGMA